MELSTDDDGETYNLMSMSKVKDDEHGHAFQQAHEQLDHFFDHSMRDLQVRPQ
jgi:hypothetical protein